MQGWRVATSWRRCAADYHWSLTDNFEWAEVWNLRFGLIEVDPLTQDRRMRPSGQIYSAICTGQCDSALRGLNSLPSARIEQKSTRKTYHQKIDGNQKRMPRERVHDRIDRSRHIENSLKHPSSGGKSGKNGPANPKNRVRTCSAHEH